jgi:putative Ca2+/H+ antiporter (TMEM165/GDT1 family)
MDWRMFATVFATTFLAEIGDKTQLAVVTFTCNARSPVSVFLGGALALVLTTLLAVLVGTGLQKVMPLKALHVSAAVAFVVIGVLLLVKALRGA